MGLRVSDVFRGERLFVGGYFWRGLGEKVSGEVVVASLSGKELVWRGNEPVDDCCFLPIGEVCGLDGPLVNCIEAALFLGFRQVP